MIANDWLVLHFAISKKIHESIFSWSSQNYWMKTHKNHPKQLVLKTLGISNIFASLNSTRQAACDPACWSPETRSPWSCHRSRGGTGLSGEAAWERQRAEKQGVFVRQNGFTHFESQKKKLQTTAAFCADFGPTVLCPTPGSKKKAPKERTTNKISFQQKARGASLRKVETMVCVV